MELVLVYRQEGALSTAPLNRVKFKSPNIFVIEAHPPLLVENIN